MKYSDLNLYVRSEVQGAPDFMIERAIRDSAIEFCSRSDIYMPEPEFMTVISGINEYAVSLPSGTELNHIIDIFENTSPLNPISYSELLQRLGDESTTGSPRYYAQRDNTDFYLAPIPAAQTTIRVMYSVKPTSNSSSIPDTVGKEHRELIAHGALYRLQMMSSQPWANPNAAGVNKQLFERGIGRVIRQVKYGFSGGSLTCKSRAFI